MFNLVQGGSDEEITLEVQFPSFRHGQLSGTSPGVAARLFGVPAMSEAPEASDWTAGFRLGVAMPGDGVGQEGFQVIPGK